MSRQNKTEGKNKKENNKNQGTAYEIVTKELHDESRVLVALLAQSVEFCDLVSINCPGILGVPVWRSQHTGDGIIKGLLGEVASLVRSIQDLVVEDRKVQGQTQANRVSRRKFGLGNFGSSLVRVK